jgi:hypothetical protein
MYDISADHCMPPRVWPCPVERLMKKTNDDQLQMSQTRALLAKKNKILLHYNAVVTARHKNDRPGRGRLRCMVIGLAVEQASTNQKPSCIVCIRA